MDGTVPYAAAMQPLTISSSAGGKRQHGQNVVTIGKLTLAQLPLLSSQSRPHAGNSLYTKQSFTLTNCFRINMRCIKYRTTLDEDHTLFHECQDFDDTASLLCELDRLNLTKGEEEKPPAQNSDTMPLAQL